MADAGDALFVAFLGTKRPRDHLVNLQLRHAPVFPPRRGAPAAAETTAPPAAHGGYLARAEGVPVQQLYALARLQGKRLVLAGAWRRRRRARCCQRCEGRLHSP